ncbi:MAG: uroporphyrinogen decarboxylase [Deltaproteobacteria bacterium]|nr:uroporphyrinogen decarboxylase [Deltaproteobacteria bacterium]
MCASPDKPLLSAAMGQQPSRYPAWFLRQAGRYLPEYQEIRKNLDFLDLCRNAEKAAEVTLQPLRRFDLDAAIIFSDILIPPAHMGMTLTFDKGHGPVLSHPVRSASDLKRLRLPDWEKDAPHTGQAITETLKGLTASQTMIGFAGAPFTVASYMIEGSGSRTFSEVKKLLFSEPQVFTGLLSMLAETTFEYLKMQVRAGAQALMLFDTWAGQLFAGDYRKYVVPTTEVLIRELQSLSVPLIYYSGQGGENLHEISSLQLDVVAVDWRTPMNRALSVLKDIGSPFKCIQGNMDPLLLSWGTEAAVRAAVRRIKAEASAAPAHIFNVGHGLLPTTSPKLLQIALDELRSPS